MISHLFFTDDLFLFGEASEGQASIVEDILKKFCGIPGQKENVQKSKLYVSQNTYKTIELCISTKWVSYLHLI